MALVVPEVGCATLGVVCGGAQSVFQAAADACGWAKNKSYAGESRIQSYREDLHALNESDRQLEALEAEAAARVAVQTEIARVGQKATA